MHRIAAQVEKDGYYRQRVHLAEINPDQTTADAIAKACAAIADTVTLAGIIIFTGSGSTARRVARERPADAGADPQPEDARRSALLWGAHAVHPRHRQL
jgi:pyruvate kinase